MGHKKSDTQQKLESLERWSARATLLILLGIVIEIGSLLWFHRDPSERLVAVIADALIGVGLVVEYIVILRAIVASGEAQRLSDEKVAEATAQAAEATAQAAEANARASEADQKAQEAILELARLTASRVLTQEQRGRIVENLKQFSGTEYDIAISSSDPEILDFVFLVEVALSMAEWAELDWQGPLDATCLVREGMPLVRLGASVTNVVIGVHVNQPTKLWECALILSDALAEGIDSMARRHIPHAMSSTNANAIHILIGRKT